MSRPNGEEYGQKATLWALAAALLLGAILTAYLGWQLMPQ